MFTGKEENSQVSPGKGASASAKKKKSKAAAGDVDPEEAKENNKQEGSDAENASGKDENATPAVTLDWRQ